MGVSELAKVVGQLIACYRSLGKNLTGLMSKGCYRVISGVGYRWDSYVKLSGEARLELQWWRDNLVRVNSVGMLIKISPDVLTVDHEFAGDAFGVGVYLMQSSGVRRTLISESFSPTERLESSALPEALVFHKFYTSPRVEELQCKTP